ncbi:MAG: N-6 DNA methylase [Synergistaceae bacterium]|nr:N-6 DNA methylase [Synergistaceae bacterium]
MTAPDAILRLVERFEENVEAYRSGRYNEMQVRREFIDPFFLALGWDVHNEKGYAEPYKDVIHEDSIRVGGATKAPDYCFRIGGTRKFFVEAKKPSVNIAEEVSPAFQLRRYAWSAKLPLSILTDFEEFAVYDTRVKPAKTDKPSAGRVMLFRYPEYREAWGKIAGVFSREAILKGSFDKYAESGKRKKGTAEVDDAFLREIETWRDVLARNIALRNQSLSTRELNFAVQRTIDRIIFLRICEDRGIELYGGLMGLLNGPNVYERLREMFHRADERYNSGLFHFHREKDRAEAPDELTLTLAVDDKPLKDMIRSLYYPDSPYEFSVLPADILGQVYEQFLGKVIRLTAGHHAVVEDKPEVKKAGGVYYTPTYIVDYIVKNTVGKLLEGKTPKQAARLRILDPACGSGSFLIGAYQHLLDWHRDWYVADGAEKWSKGRSPTLYEVHHGEWRLTTQERKRILINNIYGVDIDAQAVEVTKLSLLLKVLEGQSGEALANQLRLFHERALPDLGNNIKCGNSLIGPDFYEGKQASFLDEEETLRINAFDWRAEFSEVFGQGGFDAVIGNPPYIRMEAFKELKSYLKARYESHDERSDLYTYFIERAHSLMGRDGRFGMIVSNKFLRANYGGPLRRFLSRVATVERIADFAGLPVFAGATVRTIVLITSRNHHDADTTVYSPPPPENIFLALSSGTTSVEDAISRTTYTVSRDALNDSSWTFARPEVSQLISRLTRNSTTLATYCDGRICRGVVSGLTEAFVIDDDTRRGLLRKAPKCGEIIKPFLNGRDVRRYYVDYKKLYLIYTYHGVPIGEYPPIEEHLRPFKDALKKRATRQEWYELQQPQYNFARYMGGPKIVFPDIATHPRFALDETGYYGSNTVYFIPKRDLYLLGLLNSALANFYFVTTCAGLEGKGETYLRFFGQYLEGFPVHEVAMTDKSDKSRHDRMVALVERMLELHRALQAAKTGHEKTVVERQIAVTDGEIDGLVYALYGLTEEEIGIVEESR